MLTHNWQQKKILHSKQHQDKIYRLLNNQNYISRTAKNIVLEDGSSYTEFISCSYLGLDQDIRIIGAAANNLNDIGFIFSSSRARMKYKGLDILEDMLNNIFQAKTVIFSTTHLAHLGVIPLIASGEMPSIKLSTAGCVFLIDKTAHSSIQINRGLMQQFGEVVLVDFENLELIEDKTKLVALENKTPILLCDSVGSMGGEIDMKYFVNLVNKYQGYLYLDDAHGMSIYGKHGCGYALSALNGILPKRVIIATSLAKGFGTCGGVIITSDEKDVEFIKEFSPTYMFSGTLANPLINSSIESANIHVSNEITILQNRMLTNLKLFDESLLSKDKVINIGLNTPIRGLLIGDEELAINYSLLLRQNGIMASVASYPIRKMGSAIIRILICANHTQEDILNLCKIINKNPILSI
jgi:7-keto-8-aminopelargonate synthetase-like enzyme